MNTYRKQHFPTFYLENYLDPYKAFPCYYFAPRIDYFQDIPLINLLGDNWAFESETIRGNYPRLAKLEPLLTGYLQYPEKIPPVDVLEIMGKFILIEGNHRYYVSNMLELPTIKARIQKFDYEEWLNCITLKEDALGYRIRDTEFNEEYIELEAFEVLAALKEQVDSKV